MIYEEKNNATSNKEHVIRVFIDLSKAFDTLDHQISLEKLHFHGMSCTVNVWELFF